MADVFGRLRDYFQGIADGLGSDRTASRIFPNNPDAGSTREDVLLSFLSQHAPARCHAVRGGFIFDSEGRGSRQIDLIVTNDLTLQFRRFDDRSNPGKSFNVIEGCYAAISVKTGLSRGELFDALDNIRSIPPMPDPGGRFNPMGPRKDLYMNLPLKVVFSFEGPSKESVTKNLIEYYTKNSVPNNRRPDLIIVNNRYVIHHLIEAGELMDGTVVPAPCSSHYLLIILAPTH